MDPMYTSSCVLRPYSHARQDFRPSPCKRFSKRVHCNYKQAAEITKTTGVSFLICTTCPTSSHTDLCVTRADFLSQGTFELCYSTIISGGSARNFHEGSVPDTHIREGTALFYSSLLSNLALSCRSNLQGKATIASETLMTMAKLRSEVQWGLDKWVVRKRYTKINSVWLVYTEYRS